MQKPDDIPEDVWEAAQGVFNRVDPEGAMLRNPMLEIARAILAERERCVAIINMQDPQILTWPRQFAFRSEVPTPTPPIERAR